MHEMRYWSKWPKNHRISDIEVDFLQAALRLKLQHISGTL